MSAVIPLSHAHRSGSATPQTASAGSDSGGLFGEGWRLLTKIFGGDGGGELAAAAGDDRALLRTCAFLSTPRVLRRGVVVRDRKTNKLARMTSVASMPSQRAFISDDLVVIRRTGNNEVQVGDATRLYAMPEDALDDGVLMHLRGFFPLTAVALLLEAGVEQCLRGGIALTELLQESSPSSSSSSTSASASASASVDGGGAERGGKRRRDGDLGLLIFDLRELPVGRWYSVDYTRESLRLRRYTQHIFFVVFESEATATVSRLLHLGLQVGGAASATAGDGAPPLPLPSSAARRSSSRLVEAAANASATPRASLSATPRVSSPASRRQSLGGAPKATAASSPLRSVQSPMSGSRRSASKLQKAATTDAHPTESSMSDFNAENAQAPDDDASAPDAPLRAEMAALHGIGVPTAPAPPPPAFGSPMLGSRANTKRMRKLRWEVLPASQTCNTVWAADGGADVDLAALEALFSLSPTRARATLRDGGATSSAASSVSRILGLQRANNVSIVLRRFQPLTPDGVVSAVVAMDETVVTAERAAALLTVLPRDDETAALVAFSSDDTALGEADRFLRRLLLAAPDVHARMQTWLWKLQFDETATETERGIAAFAAATTEVAQSAALPVLLRLVVRIGSALNGTPARGVRLETLEHLPETKARDGTTALDFLKRAAVDHDAALCNVGAALPTLPAAAQLSAPMLNHAILESRRNLELASQLLGESATTRPNGNGDGLRSCLGAFRDGAAARVRQMGVQFADMLAAFRTLVRYLGEDESLSPDAFFSLLARFVERYDRATVPERACASAVEC